MRLYLGRYGRLHRLIKLHRNGQGLYLLSDNPGTRITYHEDGKYWTQEAGKKIVKQRRKPLSALSEPQSLGMHYMIIDEQGSARFGLDPATIRLAANDIVLDTPGNIVGLEMILANASLTISPRPERLNCRIYEVPGRPMIVFESFTLKGTELSGPRFHIPPAEIYHGENMPARI
jgi:hypothetical protein